MINKYTMEYKRMRKHNYTYIIFEKQQLLITSGILLAATLYQVLCVLCLGTYASTLHHLFYLFTLLTLQLLLYTVFDEA